MGLRRVDPKQVRGPVRRAWVWVAGTRPMGWLSRTIGWRVDPWLSRATGGRLGFGIGMPTALLETTGARSGLRRRNVVVYFHDGDDVILTPSRLGDPRHPDWFHNLVAHPEVVLGGMPFSAAEVTEEAELDRLWPLAIAVFPAYADYRVRAARTGRTIPLVRLTPR